MMINLILNLLDKSCTYISECSKFNNNEKNDLIDKISNIQNEIRYFL